MSPPHGGSAAQSGARWAALLALAGAAGCRPGPAEPGEGRGVLVITIDGLRADHLQSFGYDRETAPALAAFAKSCVTFEQAFATAPWALPSHASLLTGCDPNVARRMLPEGVPETLLTVWNLPNQVPRIASEYLRHGYHTAAFFEHPELSSAHGLDLGFEFYESVRESGRARPELAGPVGPFVHWLRGLDRDASWFAYVQLADLNGVWRSVDPKWDSLFAPRPELAEVPPVAQGEHVFFAIPRKNWSGGLKSMGEYEAEYDGAVRRTDEAIGRFFKLLARERRFDDTTIVICGTHGMGFGEAGLILDHGTLAPADLHVPLFIRPGRGVPFRKGHRSSALASLMDVAPTLLELSSFEKPANMQGVSLYPVLRGEREGPRSYAFASCAMYEGYAVIGERWTLEARMPGLIESRLTESWYGDALEHRDDYCEVLYERATGQYPACQPGPLGDALASELRLAGRAAFEQSHELRQRLQPSGWGVRADEVPQVPSALLWTRANELARAQR